MRNLSKNTIKKLMRKAWSISEGGLRYNEKDPHDYFLFNTGGAKLYIMSKSKICNLEPKGYKKHCKKQIKEAFNYKNSF